MKISVNINALNIYSNKFDKNAKNIANQKDLNKNLIEENINSKAFEVQKKPIKTENDMLKTLIDLKA